MTIDLHFIPIKLQALVRELEHKIKIQTGVPERLDIKLYLDKLKVYDQTRAKDDIPSISTLQYLSTFIHKVIESDLTDAYFECLNINTTPQITLTLFDFYLNNYDITPLSDYLFNNIQKQMIAIPKWELWSNRREVFFKGDIIKNIANWIIENQIDFQKIPEALGINEPRKIRQNVLSCITSDKNYFNRYIDSLHLKSIIGILQNEELHPLHNAIWNRTLPNYLDEAKQMKLNDDEDHVLFSLARLKLKPTKSPQWLALADKTKQAYQEWALGSRLETFFSDDTDNKRVKFWKGYLRYMEDVKEIEHRGEIAACCMVIGKYDFIEFKNIGAIYVYPHGAIKIPKRVKNLDHELKFKHKVVNAGVGLDYGEGRIPHLGKKWIQRANNLIRQALR